MEATLRYIMAHIHKLTIYIFLCSLMSNGGYIAPVLILFSLKISKGYFTNCFTKFYIILLMSTACLHLTVAIVANFILPSSPAPTSAVLSWAPAAWLQVVLGVVIPVKGEGWILRLLFELLPSSLMVLVGGGYRNASLAVSPNTYQNEKQRASGRSHTGLFSVHRLLPPLWLCSFVITALFLPSCLATCLLIAIPLILVNQALPGILGSNPYQPAKERHLNQQLRYAQCALVIAMSVIGVAQNDAIFWMFQRLLGDAKVPFIGLFPIFKSGDGVVWRHAAQLLGMAFCTWLTELLIAERHSDTCQEQETLPHNASHLSAPEHALCRKPQSSFVLLLRVLGWPVQLLLGCSACNAALFPSLPSFSFLLISFFGAWGLESRAQNGAPSGVFIALRVATIFTAAMMVLMQYIVDAAARCVLLPTDHWGVKIFIRDTNNSALPVVQLAMNTVLLVYVLALSHLSKTQVLGEDEKEVVLNSVKQNGILRRPYTVCSPPMEEQKTLTDENDEALFKENRHGDFRCGLKWCWNTVLTSISQPLTLGILFALTAYQCIRQQSLDVLHSVFILIIIAHALLTGFFDRHPRLPSLCVNALTAGLLLSQIIPAFEDPSACVWATPVRLHTLGLRRLPSRWDSLPYITAGFILTELGLRSPPRSGRASLPPCGLPWILLGIGLSAGMVLYTPRGALYDAALLLTMGVGIAFGMHRKEAARRAIRYATILAVVASVGATLAAIPQLRDFLFGLEFLRKHLPGCCRAEELTRGCVRDLFGLPVASFAQGLGKGSALALEIWYWGVLLLLLRLKVAPACESINQEEDDNDALLSSLMTPGEEEFPREQSHFIWTFSHLVLHPNGGLRVLALVSVLLVQAALGVVALRRPNLLNVGYAIFLLTDGLDSAALPVYLGVHASVWFAYQLRWAPAITATLPGLFTQGEAVRLESLLGLRKLPLEGNSPRALAGGADLLPLLGVALCVMLHHATRPFLPFHFLHYYMDNYYTRRWWGFLSVQLLPNLGFELLALVLLLALHFNLSSGLAGGFAAGVGLVCAAGRSRLARRPPWLRALRGFLSLTFVWVTAVRFVEAVRTKGEDKKENFAADLSWERWGWANCGRTRAAVGGWACVVALLNYRRGVPVVAHRLDLEAMHHDGQDNLLDSLRAQKVRDLIQLPRKTFKQVVPGFPYKASCAARLMEPVLFAFADLYPLLGCSCALIITSPTSFLGLAVAAGALLHIWRAESLLRLFINWRKIAPFSGLPLAISLLCNVPGVGAWWTAHAPNLGLLLGLLERPSDSTETIRPVNFTIVHVMLLFWVILQTRMYNEYQYSCILKKLYATVGSHSEKREPPEAPKTPNPLLNDINNQTQEGEAF